MAKDDPTFVERHLRGVAEVLTGLSADEIRKVWSLLEDVHSGGGAVLVAGNGGSAAIANHMANDLMLGVAKRGGRGFRAVSLSANVAVVTAIANDEGYADVYARQIDALGRRGDVVMLLSGSGESENVLRAAGVARAMGLRVAGLLGNGGGRLLPLCDAAVVVPHRDHGVVEDAFMVFDHLTTRYFCDRFATDPA